MIGVSQFSHKKSNLHESYRFFSVGNRRTEENRGTVLPQKQFKLLPGTAHTTQLKRRQMGPRETLIVHSQIVKTIFEMFDGAITKSWKYLFSFSQMKVHR